MYIVMVSPECAPVAHGGGLGPEYYFHSERLRDSFNPHALNFMKAGIVYPRMPSDVSVPAFASCFSVFVTESSVDGGR